MNLPPIPRRRRIVHWATTRFDRTLNSLPPEAEHVDCNEAFSALPWRLKLRCLWWCVRMFCAAFVLGAVCWVLQEEPT